MWVHSIFMLHKIFCHSCREEPNNLDNFCAIGQFRVHWTKVHYIRIRMEHSIFFTAELTTNSYYKERCLHHHDRCSMFAGSRLVVCSRSIQDIQLHDQVDGLSHKTDRHNHLSYNKPPWNGNTLMVKIIFKMDITEVMCLNAYQIGLWLNS